MKVPELVRRYGIVDLGPYLKNRRKKLRLSLRDVARQCRVSNAYLSMIESGRRTAPHPNLLKKLAEAYDVEHTTLMSMAGYLELSDERAEKLRTETLFDEASSDAEFSHGHRLRGETDLETKRFIVEIYQSYKRLKEEKENR